MTGEPLTIVLVEDNPDHAELVLRTMESFSVANRVVHLEDGEVALDYLYGRGAYAGSSPHTLPHLVLLDLRLPKVSGLEVLRQIKEDRELRRLPVVVLTTSDADRDVALAYEHHANGYLTKPVDFGEFSRMLKDLGFFWLAWNRCPW